MGLLIELFHAERLTVLLYAVQDVRVLLALEPSVLPVKENGMILFHEFLKLCLGVLICLNELTLIKVVQFKHCLLAKTLL